MDIDNALQGAIHILNEEELTFVASDAAGRTYRSKKRGVAPGLSLVLDGADLSGGVIADKVIGKAAALLFLLLGPAAVFGGTVSHPAREVLSKAGIRLTCDRLVDHIVNRQGDGPCPLEHSVRETDDPAEALEIIQQTLSDLRRQTHE